MEQMCSIKNRATLNETVREAMGIALLQLMENNPIQTITISEIATVAGVSRSSFYRNYESKEALLQDYITMLYRIEFPKGQQVPPSPRSEDMLEYLLPRFRFVKEHSSIYRILHRQNMLELFFQQREASLVRLLYGEEYQMSPYHRAMISGACAGLVRCWVENDFRESEETVAALFADPFRDAVFEGNR